MFNDNFYNDLAKGIRSKNIDNANKVVMNELGDTIATRKGDFILVLRNAGIPVSDYAPDAELVDLFIKNAPTNDNLLVGVAMLLAEKNKTVSADGEDEISDTGIKATYKVMNSYFDGCEEKSNWVGAIAGALGEGAKLGGKIVEGRNQKKYGAAIQQGKQQDARNQLKQSILDQRQKQLEGIEKEKASARKLQNWLLIGGGIFLAIGALAFTLHYFNKKK